MANERGDGEREGSGLMTYWREDLAVQPHYMEIQGKFQKYDTERQWIMPGNTYQNFAICNIYLRAVIPSCPDFRIHNKQMLDMLSQEVCDLSSKGFHFILIGDFNAHIGTDWEGALKNNSKRREH